MSVPSQTQGVVRRPITPHTLLLHMSRMPLLPKYKHISDWQMVYILMDMFRIRWRPETYVLPAVAEAEAAAHTRMHLRFLL